MKKLFYRPLLLLLLLTAWGARAQTLLQSQSFEANETVNYTANGFLQDDAGTVYTGATTAQKRNQYFERVTQPGVDGSSSNTLPGTIWPLNPTTGGTLDGSYFWAGESTVGYGTTRTRKQAYVALNSLNVTGKSSLQVKVALLDARGTQPFTVNDTLLVQVRFGGAGSWQTIGQFLEDNTSTTATAQGNMKLVGGTATDILTTTMKDFTFSVGLTGSAMETRVVVSTLSQSREIGFDNIRVYGTTTSNLAPVLANIETTPLAYSEGDPATALTSNLTLTDGDSPTQSSATVQLVSGYAAAEDVLAFTGNATTGNIAAGTFATSTGTLTLTSAGSTATLAQWQAALRRVTYQNTNTTNASAAARMVTFTITDPTSLSSAISRSITVTVALEAAALLPYTDDFDTDGEGTRYASNTYTNVNTSAWLRTNSNPYSPTGGTATTFSNLSNGFYWYGSVTNNSANPSTPRLGVLTTKQVNTVNYASLKFSILLGATNTSGTNSTTYRNSTWATTDYFKLYYRVAGTSTWTAFGSFRGTSTAASGASPGVLQQDATPTATTGVPTGTALGPALANFDFALPASLNGQTLDFQLVLNSADATNDFAFDNIRVTGTLLAKPTVTTGTAGSLTTTMATISSNSLTTDGGASLSDYGVVYVAGTGTPTVANPKVQVGTNSPGTFPSSFVANLTGLLAGTTYTAAAYATNSLGTSYGSNVTFSTLTSITSIALASSNPTNASSVNFQVQFAQSVTGLTTSNFGVLVLSGGITGAGVTSVSGSGTTYTVTVNTGSGDGTLALQLVNAANLSPGINNPLPFRTAGSDFIIDKTTPTVAITSTVGASGSTTSTSPIPFTVTFSEAVTGFVVGDVSVTNGTILGFSGSGTTYTFNVTPTTAGTATTVNVPVNVAQDAASNSNTAAPSTYSITLLAPLPVQLTSFTANAVGSSAHLRWATASETNNDHFEVETSADGGTFQRLGTVAGHGTTLLPQEYEFTDENLGRYAVGLLYYRLRQVDGSGVGTYSQVRPIAVVKSGLTLYPNPASHAATLSGAAAGALVQVYDARGSLVLATQVDAAGTAVLVLPAGLPGGLYLVRCGAMPALRLTVE